MRIRLFLFVFKLFLFTQLTFAEQLTIHFPSNVYWSYRWGIEFNGGLDKSQIEEMAKIVLISQGGFSRNTVDKKTHELSRVELSEIATRPIVIEYYEIPESFFSKSGKILHLKTQFDHDEQISSPVRFMKNGQPHIRWFLHPLRELPKEIPAEFKRLKGQFLAQLTESRSLLILDRKSGDYWSIKVSLPLALGKFSAKTYTTHEAQVHFENSERFQEAQNKREIEPEFLQETEAVGFNWNEMDEGQLVRSLKPLKEGGYLISYSSIYSTGLHYWIKRKKAHSSLELSRDELKWLSQEPARAAARMYQSFGASLNSNHSQNSLLLLSPQFQPVSYWRRDPDFDYHSSHPYVEKNLTRIRTSNVSPEANLNFSMLNGFLNPIENHYSKTQYKYILNEFFSNFIEYSSNGRIQKSNSFIPNLIQFTTGISDSAQGAFSSYTLPREISFTGHYSISLSKLEDIESSRIKHEEFQRVLLQGLRERFPSFFNPSIDPKSAWESVLLRPSQNRGDVQEIYRNFLLLDYKRFLSSWTELQSEFINLSQRDNSLIQRIIFNSDPLPFWNLCLLAGGINSDLRVQFLDNFIAVSLRYNRMEGLNLVFKNFLDSESFQSFPGTGPKDLTENYRRILRSLILNAQSTEAQIFIIENAINLKLKLAPDLLEILFSQLTEESRSWFIDTVRGEESRGKVYWKFKQFESYLKPQFKKLSPVSCREAV